MISRENIQAFLIMNSLSYFALGLIVGFGWRRFVEWWKGRK